MPKMMSSRVTRPMSASVGGTPDCHRRHVDCCVEEQRPCRKENHKQYQSRRREKADETEEHKIRADAWLSSSCSRERRIFRHCHNAGNPRPTERPYSTGFSDTRASGENRIIRSAGMLASRCTGT